MASTSETGHYKNVANFHDLIAYCIGYGSTYNPTKTDLTVSNMQTLETNSKNAINNVLVKKTAYNLAVDNRMDAFKGIKSLSTRLVNALQATNASDELIKDAKSYNKKIQGIRATKIKTSDDPNSPTPNTISTSQLSYDQIVQHFAGLIEVLQSEPTFSPNETALQITTLVTQKTDLTANNETISTAQTDWSNAIISRNRILYDEPYGLIHIASDVKMYVKSVFGATSDEYKQVRKIPFRNLRR